MIQGTYSDGRSSRSLTCQLRYSDDGILSFSVDACPDVSFADITVSTRIANTPRYINLPDNAVFETGDNDGVDAMVAALARHNFDVAHRLESSWPIIVTTTVFVIALAWGFIRYGIPAMSEQVANVFSEEHVRLLVEDVLSTMDQGLFESTELPPAAVDRYRSVFNELLDALGKNNIDLAFRKSDRIGANAFALPDGTVVFTDEMIELAENEDEIISIMLHEIGHIEHRHSLRIAIQSFSLAAFIAIITGDVSTSSTIITGLPVVLIESGYSREMETEADTYSLANMTRLGIEPVHFANIMERLDASYDTEYKACVSGGESVQQCISRYRERASGTRDSSSYFSSHPDTRSRIERFRHHPAES